MKGEVVEANIDYLVFAFLEIFYSSDFINVYSDLALLESEVGEKLHYFSKHNIAVLEYGLWKL